MINCGFVLLLEMTFFSYPPSLLASSLFLPNPLFDVGNGLELAFLLKSSFIRVSFNREK